jgi:hypothetical protein
VTNYPGGIGTTFDLTTAVFVENLQRIYIFGGVKITNETFKYLDTIWYIDLVSHPAFNCADLPHGSYPHSADCASFFVCVDDELAGEFTCPPPLLFDPIQQTCTKSDPAQCFLLCQGKDGLLPHPTDPSKFLF